MSARPRPVRPGPTVVNATNVKIASGTSAGLPHRRLAALSRLVARWPAAWPFLVVASASIVAGGLVAAVSRPTAFELGPWSAAYLVLVGGVAQLVLGAGTAWLACTRPPVSRMRAELVAWNLGVVATIGGTLAGAPAATTAGGLGLVVTGYWFVTTSHSAGTRRPMWVPVLWWATWVTIVSSVPVGVALAWARHG